MATHKKGVARPPANIWRPRFLKALAETGNVAAAARLVGIDRPAVYKSRARSVRFAQKWDEALEEAIELLEAEARRRASSGVVKAIYYKGEKVGEERHYSDTLLIFLLKAHRPLKYRDNVQVEHAGAVEHTVLAPRRVVLEVVRTPWSDEQDESVMIEAGDVTEAEAEPVDGDGSGVG